MINEWQVLMFQPQNSALEQALSTGKAKGYNLTRTTCVFDCLNLVAQKEWDLLLLPACLSDGTEAADMIQLFQRHGYQGAVVVLSELQNFSEVTRALQQGAMDYLLIPFGHTHLAQLVQRLVQTQQQQYMVAESCKSKQMFQLAQRVAQTDASVLISGESGSGKEVLAQFIHDSSPRAAGPFIAINCAAIPETMIESILFGHTKGAFTGATSAQAGKLETANGGTLLLDEIGELPLALQTKLLRVLQEREVERLGSHQKIKLDIHVLAATNQDLEKAIAAGRFRADLYYRLNVFPLHCASLKDRKDDIIPLANNLLRRHMPPGQASTEFTKAAQKVLCSYDWPGNVRELENVIQRALVMSRGCLIREEDLMLPTFENITSERSTFVSTSASLSVVKPTSKSQTSCTKPDLQKSRKLAEFDTIIETLRRFDGHRSKTAEELGVSTRALRYKIQTMREQGLDIEKILTGQNANLVPTNFNFS